MASPFSGQKLSAFALASLLLLQASNVLAGGVHGSGADTYPHQFFKMGREIQRWIHNGRLTIPGVSATQIGDKLDELIRSMDTESPRLRFPPIKGDTLKCSEVDKIGCVELDGSIDISRNGWKNSSMPERYEVVSIELFRLCKATEVYDKGGMVHDFVADLRSAADARLVRQLGGKTLRCVSNSFDNLPSRLSFDIKFNSKAGAIEIAIPDDKWEGYSSSSGLGIEASEDWFILTQGKPASSQDSLAQSSEIFQFQAFDIKQRTSSKGYWFDESFGELKPARPLNCNLIRSAN